MTPEEFKQIRTELNMSQTAIGQKLRKHRNTIAEYEKGTRAIPYLVAQEVPRLLTASRKEQP